MKTVSILFPILPLAFAHDHSALRGSGLYQRDVTIHRHLKGAAMKSGNMKSGIMKSGTMLTNSGLHFSPSRSISMKSGSGIMKSASMKNGSF